MTEILHEGQEFQKEPLDEKPEVSNEFLMDNSEKITENPTLNPEPVENSIEAAAEPQESSPDVVTEETESIYRIPEKIVDVPALNAETVQAIFADETSFEQQLGEASLGEMVVLMETIASEEQIKSFIGKSHQLKKAFDARIFTLVQQTEGVEAEEIARNKELGIRFNTAYSKFNHARILFDKQMNEMRAANSKIKEELLGKLRVIVDSEDLEAIEQVRDIQKSWKTVGQVRQEDSENFYQTYKALLDKYYGLREKYFELIEKDRQYNLIQKKALIDEARLLVPDGEKDRDYWKDATEALSNLHSLWKTIGPVSRELSESNWQEFTAVCDQFYEARNAFYQGQDASRGDNGIKKKELLEKLKVYSDFTPTKIGDWRKAADEIQVIQKEWRAIGPATVEENKEIWKLYRQYCDAFFTNKQGFFKNLEESFTENLRKKNLICEKAEALKDSNDWKRTADAMMQLQEEWKNIGPISEKDSERVWKRFRSACNDFFERRTHHLKAFKAELTENLEKKAALVQKVEALVAENAGHEHIETVKALQQEWNQVGPIARGKADKIWHQFRTACDTFFNNLSNHRREGSDRPAGAGGGGNRFRYDTRNPDAGNKNQFGGEERKLRDRLNLLKEEIIQYENNVLFISKGKSGDILREEIARKVNLCKEEITKLQAKLKAIKAERENAGKAQESAPEAVASVAAEAPAETQAPEVAQEVPKIEEVTNTPDVAEAATPEASASEPEAPAAEEPQS